jgi:1A family penicillin-binding protein
MPRRKYYRRIYKKNKKLGLFLKILGGGFLFSVFLFSVLFIYYAKDLPRPEDFAEKSFVLPTKIYDRSGKILLYQIYDEEKRTVIPLTKVPEHLKQAVLVAEDDNFYRHFGLDIMGIFRSVLKNLKIGRPLYGGSTISQQLVRSSFLTREKTVQRKVKEVILTLELERRYSKDKILEFYLNQIPFGSNAYGVEAASQTYFSTSTSQLTLAQSALLASLIRAPSYLSPYGSHKDELLARKDYILSRMVEKGYITEKEQETAQTEPLEFAEIRHPIKAPHFVLYVKDYLEQRYSDYFLKEKGLKVYTTLDWELQKAAEKIVKEGTAQNRAFNVYNAALVAQNPRNGHILAMVGSANWHATGSHPEGCEVSKEGCLFDPKVNVAVYGEGRQPGSAFKPFAYFQALKEGLTPETILWDAKTEFNPDCSASSTDEKDEWDLDCYHPKNYDEKFRGPVTLRQALAQSINLPSVKVLYLAGVKETIDLAKTLGITTLEKPLSWYGLSLVLGGGEVRLLDLVSAYGVFANRGLKVPPLAVIKIEDAEGNIIEENKKTPKRILEAEVVDQLNDILSDNEARGPMFGTRSPLYVPGYQVAAKTGTTQEYKDAWTIGYSSSIVVGVWAGNNNGAPADEKPGVVLAGPMWHRFMTEALKKYPSSGFEKPKPIETDVPALKGEVDWQEPHSIIHYINENPELDPQYNHWEYAIQSWLKDNK